MPWGKVDDKLWGSPKWLGTPMRARGLWCTALSYCMDQLTDGAVPKHVLATLGGTRKDAADLVQTGLWEETVTGWLFHDWLEFQPSREQILAERAAAADRQRRAREKAKQKRDQQQDHDVTRESRRDSHRDYTRESRSPRPDPTRPNISSSHQSSGGTLSDARGDQPPPPNIDTTKALEYAGLAPWEEDDFTAALKASGARSTSALILSLHGRNELSARIDEWRTERDRAARAPRVIAPNITKATRGPDGAPVTELCDHDFEVGRCPQCRATGVAS